MYLLNIYRGGWMKLQNKKLNKTLYESVMSLEYGSDYVTSVKCFR